jgi:hypothetical protein
VRPHGRRDRFRAATRPAARAPRRARADCGAARADARQALEAAIDGGHFQGLERFDAEFVVHPVRKFGADTRDGAEQRVRVGLSAQPFELLPAAGLQQLGDGRGDARSDARQGFEPGRAVTFVDFAQGLRQLRDDVRRFAIGGHPIGVVALRGKQHTHLAQGLRDLRVVCGRWPIHGRLLRGLHRRFLLSGTCHAAAASERATAPT